MDFISEINAVIYRIVGGLPMISVLLATGLFCTVTLKGLQFTKLGIAMKNALSKFFDRSKAGEGSLTPFQAVCTALASTLGTGSIAGVAGAIALGGPGAVFWMWISALFGMATKYAEITLAIRYRERNSKGDWVGGPMYYIKNGLGKGWKWLAVLFALFCMLASFGIGNMTQVNTIATSVSGAVTSFAPALSDDTQIIHVGVGILVAFLLGLILFGGLKRIGSVTEKLIPVMSVLYILGALTVVLLNYRAILPVFGMIFRGAFQPQAVCGGVAGMTIMTTLTRGVGRGIFTNEAGLGSAPIAHASADTDSPVRQGLFGIFEVFIASIVICTLTALTILTSGIGVPYGESCGADLTTSAFASVFGGKFAALFMAIAIALFALSTILGWSLYGACCAEFLFGKLGRMIYLPLYIAVSLLGAVAKLDLVWAISDTLNCFMAIPNLIAILLLGSKVRDMTNAFFDKEGKAKDKETKAEIGEKETLPAEK